MQQKFVPSVCPWCQWSKLLSPTEVLLCSPTIYAVSFPFFLSCFLLLWLGRKEERDNGGQISLASQVLQCGGILGCSEILVFQSVMRGMESLVGGWPSGSRKRLCTSVAPDCQKINCWGMGYSSKRMKEPSWRPGQQTFWGVIAFVITTVILKRSLQKHSASCATELQPRWIYCFPIQLVWVEEEDRHVRLQMELVHGTWVRGETVSC